MKLGIIQQEPSKDEPVKEGTPDPKANEKEPVTKEEFQKVQEQLTNLNKGIATYRDEANTWKSKFEQLAKQKIEVDLEDDDAELNPEDEKKLKAWAKKQGLVTAREFEAEKLRIQQDNIRTVETEAVNEFLDKHPEYDDEDKWAKLQAEFSLYKTPTTLDGYRKILKKSLDSLTGGKTKDDAKSAAKAEILTKGRLSLGGGNQRSVSDGADDDMDSLRKRYPSLSEEQIKARKAEIDVITKERQKK